MSSSMSGSGRGGRQNKRPAPLRMVKEEVRQYRPPVIIHTYSPKVIHVDAAEFSSLVQRLTGRGKKRKSKASPRAVHSKVLAYDFHCASPSSSADSGIVSALEGPLGLISPRGPLAPYEHYEHFDNVYQQQQSGEFEVSCVPPQAQDLADKGSGMFSNNVLRGAVASGGPQYAPLFSAAFPSSLPLNMFSSLPSPLLSPNFMADLPVLSPSTYQAFDAFNSHSFMPSPGYGKFTGSSGLMPSPGSNNAYMDMAFMMSRD